VFAYEIVVSIAIFIGIVDHSSRGSVRVVHLGRSTCHAISGLGDSSTRIPDG